MLLAYWSIYKYNLCKTIIQTITNNHLAIEHTSKKFKSLPSFSSQTTAQYDKRRLYICDTCAISQLHYCYFMCYIYFSMWTQTWLSAVMFFLKNIFLLQAAFVARCGYRSGVWDAGINGYVNWWFCNSTNLHHTCVCFMFICFVFLSWESITFLPWSTQIRRSTFWL